MLTLDTIRNEFAAASKDFETVRADLACAAVTKALALIRYERAAAQYRAALLARTGQCDEAAHYRAGV